MNGNTPIIVVEKWGFAFPRTGLPQFFQNRIEFLEDFQKFLQDDTMTWYSTRGQSRLYGIGYRPGKGPDKDFIIGGIRSIEKAGEYFIMKTDNVTLRVKRSDYNNDLRRLLTDFVADQADKDRKKQPRLTAGRIDHYYLSCYTGFDRKNLL